MKNRKIFKKHYIFFLFAVPLLLPCSSFSQDEAPQNKPGEDDIVAFMEEGMKEIDYYSLEELLDVEVEVASLFEEDELVVGSTVSSIPSEKWKMMGARRMHEALNNEMGVHTTPNIAGIYNIAVRGYTATESMQGIATLIDGVPVNLITMGTAFGAMPNIELGVLDKIEMIKGPGSAIYGSDAFHGVLLLKTFESDKDSYSIEGAGGYPLYCDANLKISQGFGDDLVRVDAAVSGSRQGDQDQEYNWEIRDESGSGTRKLAHDSGSGVFKVRVSPWDDLMIKVSGYSTYFDCEEYPGTYIVRDMSLEEKDFSSNNAKYYIGAASVSYRFENSISLIADAHYGFTDLEYTLMTTKASSITQKAKINQSGGQLLAKQEDNSINLQWIAAFSYVEGKFLENSYFHTIGSIASEEKDLPSDGFTRKIKSTFTQLKWGAIENRLFLLFGGRIDDYSEFGTQVTPRGGVIFLPTEKSSFKALYGRAFKAPTQLQIYGFPGIASGNSDVKPETIDVYELIFIYKEKKWKTSVSAFYSKWKNAIQPVRVQGSDAIYDNAGKNDSIGGEITQVFSVFPFDFDLGFAYAKSVMRNTESLSNFSGSGDIRYYQYPLYSVHGALNYFFKPAAINFYLNNRVYFSWRGSNVRDVDDLPPYYRMDFNISRAFNESFEFYLDIRNLLNRENHLPGVMGAEDGFTEPGIGVMLRAGYRL